MYLKSNSQIKAIFKRLFTRKRYFSYLNFRINLYKINYYNKERNRSIKILL